MTKTNRLFYSITAGTALLALLMTGCAAEEKKAAPSSTPSASASSSASLPAGEEPAESGESAAVMAPGQEAADIEVVNEGGGEDAPADQGDPHVWIKGTLSVEDNAMTVSGTTNAPAGAELKGNVTAKGYSMWGYDENAEVRADGTFSMTLEKPELKNGGMMDVEISFIPYLQADAVEESYGSKGEMLASPYIHQYKDGSDIRKKASVYIEVPSSAKPGTQLDIPVPSGEKPKDYGEPNVWIKPVVTNDDDFYYVKSKSNLLEGTTVKANVDIPDHWHYGYTDQAVVGPDGSFTLQIGKPKDIDMFYLLLQMIPDEEMWEDAAAAYGTKGENLKGDYVAVEQTDEGAVRMIEMKLKVSVK